MLEKIKTEMAKNVSDKQGYQSKGRLEGCYLYY